MSTPQYTHVDHALLPVFLVLPARTLKGLPPLQCKLVRTLYKDSVCYADIVNINGRERVYDAQHVRDNAPDAIAAARAQLNAAEDAQDLAHARHSLASREAKTTWLKRKAQIQQARKALDA